ncbi:MAG: hypothetical protein LIO97_08940 [Tannerellaceae bacterium]|nr:hypothetical protein [Tannerellaceae bacterium]
MNKRFFTLLTSFLLAFSFMASAQISTVETGKYENGKFYLLGDGTRFLTITDTESEGWSYQASMSVPTTLSSLNNYLWEVEVNKASATSLPEYTFINRKTGLKLSFDTSDLGSATESAQLGGNIARWLNGVSSTAIEAASPVYYYVDDANVVYIANSGQNVYGKKVKVNDLANVSDAFNIQPYTLDDVLPLSADDLNELLCTNSESMQFALSFDKEVSEGQVNLFTESDLRAEDVATSGYVN